MIVNGKENKENNLLNIFKDGFHSEMPQYTVCYAEFSFWKFFFFNNKPATVVIAFLQLINTNFDQIR